MTDVTRAPNVIDELEAKILTAPQLGYELRHYFADGLYAREITIPAHAILTGERHLQAHINVISKGRILVAAEGETIREIVAPYTFIAHAGTRRAGRTLEETVWTTIHATEQTTVDAAEQELIAPNDNPLVKQLSEGTPCLS